MARQEATSIFSDGLMSDLHPINTPKSVLTDCLNGTYVTYNGNEFILQNDMGNYELKNCKLSTNFIPVGVKGYADILYIVSYNPLTKEVEVGSYPSPQRKFNTGTGEKSKSLTPFLLDENGTYEYTKLIDAQKQPLYIFGKDTNDDSFKLFPGDEFTINFGDEELKFIYQHLNFYVIDEDNKLYDIDDANIYLLDNLSEEERKKYLTEDGYRKVFWETPGWLAAQYDLYVPDKFNLNINSLTTKEFINPGDTLPVTLELSTQTIITNLLFQSQLVSEDYWSTDESKHLKIRFLIRKGNGYGLLDTTERFKEYEKDDNYWVIDIPCKKHNYQDNIITAFTNLNLAWNFTVPEDLNLFTGKIRVEAFPIIYYNNRYLEYDQFRTVFEYDLKNTKSTSEIKIAENTYKWAVDTDSCTISFDLEGPFVNGNTITGRYEIYRVNRFNYVNEKPTTDIIYTTNQKSWSNWNEITKTVNASKFGKLNANNEFEAVTEITELGYDSCYLMCDGTISNLVLRGQNTININWNDSNVISLNEYKNWYAKPTNLYGTITPISSVGPVKPTRNYEIVEDYRYTTPGTKNLNFSKEGGIYKLRIIIEQNGEYQKHVDKWLIPSEVFNEWFGSIDNYENISGSTWVNKYIDSISVNQLEFNDFAIDFTESVETDTSNAPWLYYKWSKSILGYKAVTKEAILPVVATSNLSISDKYKLEEGGSYNNFNVSFIQLLDLIIALKYPKLVEFVWNDAKETFETKYKASSTSIIEDTLLLQVRYSDLNPRENTDFVFNLNYLSGNLWNPIIDTDIQIKQNSTNVISLDGTNDTLTVSLDSLKDDYSIDVTVNTHSLRNELSSFCPFLDSLSKRYFLSIESDASVTSGNMESSMKNAWAISQWDANFQTINNIVSRTNTPKSSSFVSETNTFYTDLSRNIYNRSIGFLFGIRTGLTVTNAGSGEIGIDWGVYNVDGSLIGNAWKSVTVTKTGISPVSNKGNFNKTDYYIIIPVYKSDQMCDTCTVLSMTDEQFYTLCRIKIVQLGPRSDHWYIQDLSDISWTTDRTVSANKYSAETKVTIIRVDDYDWKVNTSDDMLFNVDYLSTNNTTQNGQVNLLLDLDFSKNKNYSNKIECVDEWLKKIIDEYNIIISKDYSNPFRIEVCDADDTVAASYFDNNKRLKIFSETTSTNYREITMEQIVQNSSTSNDVVAWFENNFKPINSSGEWIKGNYGYKVDTPSSQMGFIFDNNKGGIKQSFTYFETLQWTLN